MGIPGTMKATVLAAGRIRAKPLVTHTFPLAEVGRAFEAFETRLDDPIKVILHP